MEYEDNDISAKSQMITLVLCLVFGRLGAHRFYIGKYITGALFFLFGCTSLVFDFLGFGFTYALQMLFNFILLIDLHALYSDSFTDKNGRLIVGKSKTLIYNTYAERDRLIFEEKLNKLMLILLSVAAYIVYFIIRVFVIS